MAITHKKDESRSLDEELGISTVTEDSLDSEHTSIEPDEEGELLVVEEHQTAAQLGVTKYVYFGLFAAGLISTYILSRTVFSLWTNFASKDWFSRALPFLASVGDDEKNTVAFILAGIVSLVVVLRTYRKPAAKAWCEGVAGELASCKWPNKKEVTNYTTVVIIASALATTYLALLDRFYSFVTNLVYGSGA